MKRIWMIVALALAGCGMTDDQHHYSWTLERVDQWTEPAD